jgi:hypothetical protein
MANLHDSVDQATSSGLFGRLVKEPIQLVDAFDDATTQRYHQLWSTGPPRDREPAAFFGLTLSTENFKTEYRDGVMM